MNVIKPKHYTNAWITVISITIFFVAFFNAYFVGGHQIGTAFVRSVVVYFVTYLISKIMVLVWHFSIPKDQWLIMANGAPEVETRSQRLQRQREEQAANEGADLSGGIVEMDFD